MKIPLLYQLEKGVRKLRKKTNRTTVNTASKYYKAKFEQFLSDYNYPIRDLRRGQFKQPATSDAPLVSIIIPCYNQFEYTRKCINSIAINTSHSIAYEILLIDDNSTDATADIEAHYPTLRVLRNESNQGFLRNVNRAATEAKGQYLLLLNNDTVVLKDWLDSMLRVIQQFPDVGAVGSKLIYPNGMLQEAGGYISQDQHFGNFGKFQSIFAPNFNYTREVDYVSGASFLIVKSLWEQLGGFDEVYLPAYFEDTDLCMRVRSAGYRVMYAASSNVLHYESISYGKSKASQKEAQMDKNRDIFLQRWEREMLATHLPKALGEVTNFERKGHKQTILYVDHDIPNEYSCGAKLTRIYCNLLVEMGYCVKYLPMYVNPADLPSLPALAEQGIECIIKENPRRTPEQMSADQPASFEAWFKDRYESFDHILLARPKAIEYLEVIRKYVPDIRYCYHPADLHFLRLERENSFNSEGTAKKAETVKKQTDKKEVELALLRDAERVLHVSTYEADYLEKHYAIDNAAVIPCLFFDEASQQAPSGSRKELLFVGSRHHASIDGLEWFLEEILPKVVSKHPETLLKIAGDCCKVIKKKKHIKALGRVSDQELSELYQTCISIIPLRFGAGVKGKTLEAMNYETPFVTTSVGLEGIVNIDDAKPAFDDATAFADELCKTLEDETHQAKEILECKRIIETFYTKKAARKTLSSILEPSEASKTQALAPSQA